MVYIYGNMQMLMGNPTSWDSPTGINGLSCSGHYDCWGKKTNHTGQSKPEYG